MEAFSFHKNIISKTKTPCPFFSWEKHYRQDITLQSQKSKGLMTFYLSKQVLITGSNLFEIMMVYQIGELKNT
jgi:hypothetical protein